VYIDDADYRAGLAESASNPYERGGSSPWLSLFAGNEAAAVGPVAIAGLRPGTTYHYALQASNEGGTALGPDATFVTAPPTPPTLSEAAVSGVTQDSATIETLLDPHGKPARYELELGLSAEDLGVVASGNVTTPTRLEIPLTALLEHTTYHYRLVGVSADGESAPTPEGAFTTNGGASDESHLPPPLALPPIAFPTGTPAGQGGVLGTKQRHARNARKLAAVLKACKRAPKRAKASCEKRARRRYG
jgi:hypothetical protein